MSKVFHTLLPFAITAILVYIMLKGDFSNNLVEHHPMYQGDRKPPPAPQIMFVPKGFNQYHYTDDNGELVAIVLKKDEKKKTDN